VVFRVEEKKIQNALGHSWRCKLLQRWRRTHDRWIGSRISQSYNATSSLVRCEKIKSTLKKRSSSGVAVVISEVVGFVPGFVTLLEWRHAILPPRTNYSFWCKNAIFYQTKLQLYHTKSFRKHSCLLTE
jgi:hypothetical protein